MAYDSSKQREKRSETNRQRPENQNSSIPTKHLFKNNQNSSAKYFICVPCEKITRKRKYIALSNRTSSSNFFFCLKQQQFICENINGKIVNKLFLKKNLLISYSVRFFVLCNLIRFSCYIKDLYEVNINWYDVKKNGMKVKYSILNNVNVHNVV